MRDKCTVLKTVIYFATFLSYEPLPNLSTSEAINCHCEAIRPIFMFQILNFIADTALETANLVTKLQQTITLATKNCNFDNQFAC